MRKLGIITLCLALFVGGSVIWYRMAYPAFTYRLRLTVAVDVSGVEKSGSSVIGIEGKSQPPIGGAPPIYFTYHGDAVFIDLGNGRNVIATLGFGANGNGDLLYSLAPVSFRMSTKDVATKLAGSGRRAELQDKLIPTFVTFSDANDPKTARVVDRSEFEQVFGHGIRFKGAWIELTHDPVTRGIEKNLTWLVRMKSDGLGGRIEAHPGRFTVNVPYFARD